MTKARTDYKQLCNQLFEAYQTCLGDSRFSNRLAKRAGVALAKPDPPSLKLPALIALADAVERNDSIATSEALPIIREALKSLPD